MLPMLPSKGGDGVTPTRGAAGGRWGQGAKDSIELPLDTDDLVQCYTALADDSTQSSKAREAAQLVVLAEGHLQDDGEYDLAGELAERAAESFADLGDRRGQADAWRLVFHARRQEIDAVAYTADYGFENVIAEVCEKALEKAAAQERTFKAQGDTRGEAAMLLSQAEVREHRLLDGHGEKADLEDVLIPAMRARKVLRGVDLLLEGRALLLMATIHYRKAKKSDEDTARALTQQALDSFRGAQQAATGSEANSRALRRQEGKAFHLLAFGHMLLHELDNAVDQARKASQIFAQLDAPSSAFLVAFEDLAMARFYLGKNREREALPLAKQAHDAFETFGPAMGWQAAARDVVVQSYLRLFRADKALQLAEKARNEYQGSSDWRQLAHAWTCIATVHVAQGKQEDAKNALDNSLAIVCEHGDARYEASVYLDIAFVLVRSRCTDEVLEEAMNMASKAAVLYKDLGDRTGEASVLSRLYEIWLVKGNNDEMKQRAMEQAALYKELGEESLAAHALLVQAGILFDEKNEAEAIDLGKQALEEFKEMQDIMGEATAARFLATASLSTEEYEEALHRASEIGAAASGGGKEVLLTIAAQTKYEIFMRKRDYRNAQNAANEGLRYAKKGMDKGAAVDFLLQNAEATLGHWRKSGSSKSAQGLKKAMSHAREAMRYAFLISDGRPHQQVGRVFMTLMKIEEVGTRHPEALSFGQKALDIFVEVGDKFGEATTVLSMAEIYYSSGMIEKVVPLAEQAKALAEELCYEFISKKAEMLLAKLTGPPMQYAVLGAGVTLGAAPGQAAGVAQPDAAVPGASADSAVAVKKGLERDDVMQVVQELAKSSIGLDEVLFLDSPLMDSGMDSLTAVSFRNSLQENLAVKLPSSLMFDYPTMKEVADRIVELSLEDGD